MIPRILRLSILIVGLGWILAACGETPITSPEPLPSSSPILETHTPDQPTETPPPPTATPVPLAAVVNGEPLTLAEYQAELARFQSAQVVSGTNLATEEVSAWVLDDLIDQMLLAQAAREAGFVVDEMNVQTRMDSLATQLGSGQVLTDWITAHGYSEEEFRLALGREMGAAWMRDQIIAGVPETTDQVHARQILLYNSGEAAQVYAQLNAGQDFEALAIDYDPVTGGDLGWFPRGYLTVYAVEETAFSMQPGQYSEVLETTVGFQIIQVVERDPQHLLSADARLLLQVQALEDWMAARRSQSVIQVLLP
jgi:peptidyl-prolyl cis-trans isomerase C